MPEDAHRLLLLDKNGHSFVENRPGIGESEYLASVVAEVVLKLMEEGKP